jgi:hypothetical protein
MAEGAVPWKSLPAVTRSLRTSPDVPADPRATKFCSHSKSIEELRDVSSPKSRTMSQDSCLYHGPPPAIGSNSPPAARLTLEPQSRAQYPVTQPPWNLACCGEA